MAESAALYSLPKPLAAFAAVEFPGIVAPSHTSLEAALDTLGGLKTVSACLGASAETAQTIEMDLGDPRTRGFNFLHPVAANTVNTSNILLKVTRRKRKRKSGDAEDARVDSQGRALRDMQGLYTAEIVGVVTRTIRFRGMADFQYQPKIENDPIVNLAKSLRTMDVEGIEKFEFAPLSEDYSADDLNMFPPPLFSRQVLPHSYRYKASITTTRVTNVNAQGQEITRMISKSRYKTSSAVAISFCDHGPVPTAPSPLCKGINSRADELLLERVNALMEKRPMWTRLALANQLQPEESRRVSNTAKQIIGLSSYTFSDGPFREMVIRFGYDPREEEDARQYQRLMLRVVNPQSGKRRTAREGTMLSEDSDARSSHIFDGRTPHRDIGNYQFCDITDPLLRQLLDDRQWQMNFCNERGGWYLPTFVENFREILRFKFVGLLNGRIVADTECADAVDRLPDERTVLAEKRTLRGGIERRRPVQEDPLEGIPPVPVAPRLNHSKKKTAPVQAPVAAAAAAAPNPPPKEPSGVLVLKAPAARPIIAKASNKPKAKRKQSEKATNDGKMSE